MNTRRDNQIGRNNNRCMMKSVNKGRLWQALSLDFRASEFLRTFKKDLSLQHTSMYVNISEKW
jgi:hypothetical protein